MKKPAPDSLITSDMTVLDVVSGYSSTVEVFRRYDSLAGKCICCSSLFETVGDVARANGLDLEKLLRDLEEAAERDSADESSPA